jgi:hypothetical protein
MYDTAAPGTITERHSITGLEPTETIMGLDVRPAKGKAAVRKALKRKRRVGV